MKKYNAKKWKKISNGEIGHIPNKNEAKKLRQIMSVTGMSEEEIRSIRHYCVELSNASQSGEIPKRQSKQTRYLKSLVKKACRETSLSKEHPATIEALDRIIEKEKSSCFVSPFLTQSMRAVHVLRLVGKVESNSNQ